MQAQLSSQKKQHDQEFSILERGLEMEFISSKVKKRCDENKKMYQMEVEKNEKLEVKNEEMESTHKKNITGLTVEWEERTTLRTKENTALSKQQLEENWRKHGLLRHCLNSRSQTSRRCLNQWMI